MKTINRLMAGIATTVALTSPALAQTAATPGDVTTSAAPADPVPSTDGDIIVTAQKRGEAIQRVPITIAAFNADALVQAGINSPADLQRIAPTFKFTSVTGTLGARFAIRGIGTFNNSAIEPSVASFVDGIYIPRPSSILNSLLDVEAVEVLSGPQGTLFGRNASTGAVSYRTPMPSSDGVSGSLRTEFSTGARFRTEGAINLPVNDRIAVRVAGLADLFGGYWRSSLTNKRFGGLDTHEGRASVKADLTDRLTWVVRGDYQSNKGSGNLNQKLIAETLTPTTLARLTAVQGVAPDLDLGTRSNNVAVDGFRIDDRIWGVSSDLSYETAGGATIRMLNGHYDWNSRQSDGDTSNLAVYVLGRDLHYTSNSDSHEIQFISPKGQYLGGKFDFVGGVYYFDEELGIRADSLNGSSFCATLVPNPALPFGTVIPGATTADRVTQCRTYTGRSTSGDFNQTTRSLAGYVQATLAVLPTLDLTGGIRYTDERKRGTYVGTVFNPTGVIIAANETTQLALNEDRVTYRANLAWRPTRDVMLFGTVSTGFKSGGFNNGVATRVIGQDRIFAAESVTNYEIGAKSQFADRRITLNSTLFRMDVDNFQERSIVGLISTIRNVGKVRQQGVEFEGVVRPASWLRLNASGTYIDSEIRSYPNGPQVPYRTGTQNLAGIRLNYNPKWSGLFAAEVDGKIGSGWTWSLNGDATFTTRQSMGTTIDNGPLLVEPGYTLFNARLTFAQVDQRLSFSLFARNIGDRSYCASRVYAVLEGPLGLRYDANGDGVNDGTAVRCTVGAPRVIGVTAGLKF